MSKIKLVKYEKYPYLFRNEPTKIFYFNRQVPIAARPTLDKQLIRISLDSTELHLIFKKYEAIAKYWDELIRYHKEWGKTGKEPDWYLEEKRVTRPKALTKNDIKLSELINTYCDLKYKIKEDWTEATYQDSKTLFNTLTDYFNDIYITEITDEKALHFVAELKNMPSRRTKKYQNKSLKQIMNLQIKKEEIISLNTFNKYITRISSLFIYAVEKRKIKFNPFQKLGVNTEKLEKSIANIYPFTQKEVTKIFKHIKDDKYKIIASIGLHSGMRLGEITGLHHNSIYEIDGILVFDTSKNKLNIKSKAQRLIPVHPKIKKEILALKNTEKGNLFPDLSIVYNRNYRRLSYWFNVQVLKPLGFKEADPSDDKRIYNFHSLRNTVAEELKQQMFKGKTDIKIIEAILGHKDRSLSTGTYGTGKVDLEHKLRTIKLLKFNI